VESFLVSTLVVGLAEIGDKTQILSLMLAARFRRPLPIIFGILLPRSPTMPWPGWPARLPAPCSAARGCGGSWDSRF
jgi:hypothetical protein